MIPPLVPLDGDGDRVIVQPLTIGDLLDLPKAPVPEVNRVNRMALERDMARESDAENRQWRGGVRSLQAGVDVVMRGWTEGLEALTRLTEGLEDLVPPPQSRRRVRAWGDDGDEVSVDRVFGGSTEMFRTTRRAVRTGVTRLCIVGEWGVNGNATQQDLYWTGAAMTLLSSLLEPAGYATDLSLVGAVGWNRRMVATAWENDTYSWGRQRPSAWGWTHDLLAIHLRVKEAGEALVPETVIATAAHIGVWRSLGFACTQLVPWDCTPGMGSAAEAALVLPALQQAGMVDAHIVIPRLRTARQTVTFLRNVLADVGTANLYALEA